jgi:uncharacterized membrane protein
MNKMLVAVFEGESKAYEGFQALKGLHTEGSIALYGVAVIAKNSERKVSLKQAADWTPFGPVLNVAIESLIGLLGGPVSVAAGAATRPLASALADLANTGVGVDFLDEVSQVLLPGKAAVVAEINEERVIPVDTRLEALGGVVFRRARAETGDAQIERDIATFKAEIKSLQTEQARATGEASAKLEARIEAAQLKLQAARDRAQARVEAVKLEAEAKVKSLQDQLSTTQGRTRARLELRLAQLRADYEVRSAKLNRSWQLTNEALTGRSW